MCVLVLVLVRTGMLVRVRVRMPVLVLRLRLCPGMAVPRGDGGAGSRDGDWGRGHAHAPDGAGRRPACAEGVDLEAEADDLLACLGEELALLAVEEGAGRAEGVRGWGGREEGHELVAGGWCGELAACGEGALWVERDVHVCGR